jgi:hypothetical protein
MDLSKVENKYGSHLIFLKKLGGLLNGNQYQFFID